MARELIKSNMLEGGGGAGESFSLGKWNFETATGTPPSSNSIRLNNSTPASATKLYIHDLDDQGTNYGAKLSGLPSGSVIYIFVDDTTNFQITISGATDQSAYVEFDISGIIVEGTISNGTEVSVNVDLKEDISWKADKLIPLGSLNAESNIAMNVSGYYSSYTPPSDFTPTFTLLTDGARKRIPLVLDGVKSIIIPNGSRIYGETFEDNVAPDAGEYDLWVTYIDDQLLLTLIHRGVIKGLNLAPSITEVNLTGTISVGQALGGNYSGYTDPEDDPEDTSGSGSQYELKRYDDEFAADADVDNSSGTSMANGYTLGSSFASIYTIQSGDNGKGFLLWVRPRDDQGNYGEWVKSAYSGGVGFSTLSTPTLVITPSDQKNIIEFQDEDVNATGRQLLRSTINDLETATAIPGYTGSVDPYEDTGLTNNVTYYYWGRNTASGYNSSEYATGIGTPSDSQPSEYITWKSLVNTTQNANDLIKTGGSLGSWDAGAISDRRIPSGNGWVEHEIVDAYPDDNAHIFGLSADNPDAGYTGIDFGVVVQNGAYIVFENGSNKGSFSTPAPQDGDIVRIAVEGGEVKYYLNGNLKYTSLISPGYPLFADCSIKGRSSGVPNPYIKNAKIQADDGLENN